MIGRGRSRDDKVRQCARKTSWMKTPASTCDHTDGRLVLIGVVVADSSWSSNNDGESHGGCDGKVAGGGLERNVLQLVACVTRSH